MLITFEMIGPCQNTPLFETQYERTQSKTVGELTIKVLDQNKIPYYGNPQGIHTAYNTPVGDEALEVISDREMRSYGWCYSVDGKIPELFPHQYKLKSSMKKITWFFGYAHYYNGEWVAQCLPAHKIKPAFICKNRKLKRR